VTGEPALERGIVADELEAEFPELALVYTTVAARRERSPTEVRARLRQASDRFTGARAIALRQQPIPWAYRVFFRHIGFDPDERRTPIEAAAVERLRAGGFVSRDLIADALLIGTLDTSVALEAFDADGVHPPLALRLSAPSEPLGGEGFPLPRRQLVIADADHALAQLFGHVAERHAVSRATERVVLCAVQVKGIPDVVVEEALWIATDVLLSHTRTAG
jgi:DNA/RNA-binding domain of Phe-tRNA-synthetase-like protein